MAVSHPPSLARQVAAWGVHLYTGLGLPLAFAALIALVQGDGRLFFVLNMAAIVVDATDGFLARAAQVKQVLPGFDGRKLDDLIDFLTFAFLPAAALPMLGLLPPNLAWVAVFPLMASGYGFCQQWAKTDDAFVGFPSYWNIVALYLFVLQPPVWLTITVLAVFTVLVFVPIHYVYPTRTRLLRPLTLALCVPYTALAFLLAWVPDAWWSYPAALGSLTFPVYYFVLSGVHHVRVHRS